MVLAFVCASAHGNGSTRDAMFCGGAWDAVAAWIFGNIFRFYCYNCRASKDESRVRPATARTRPIRPVVTATELPRRDAHRELQEMHLTTYDEFASVNTDGKQTMIADGLHTSDGTFKHSICKGIMSSCNDSRYVIGMIYSVQLAAAVINDHIACNVYSDVGPHVYIHTLQRIALSKDIYLHQNNKLL